MSFLSLGFGAPLMLAALALLPIIWWLLRLTPPKPNQELFPPIRILQEVVRKEETPAHSPWWLTLLRLTIAALIILALAKPIWDPPEDQLTGEGSLLLYVDNGWTAGRDWEQRKKTALQIINEADETSRPVILVLASESTKSDLAANNAATARERVLAAQAHPVAGNDSEILQHIVSQVDAQTIGNVIWLSGGLTGKETSGPLTSFASLADNNATVFSPDISQTLSLASVRNEPDAMTATVQRLSGTTEIAGTLRAFDLKDRIVGEQAFTMAVGSMSADIRFELPVELRNEIARVEIVGGDTAASVKLLDERFLRRRVGLISGEKNDFAQPLLSPLYYISRALEPYSELRQPVGANVDEITDALIELQIATLILADIGTLSEQSSAKIRKWVNEGGMLIRFAGPRLAGATNDRLVPTPLRRGGRDLGGSLTWGTPQPLARFEAEGPFFGLNVPEDVTVTRQVLAEPVAELPDRTWASLADGTPLVTASKTGRGWIVLFHVTADASWSNLAISGTFVDMLHRLTSLSSAVSTTDAAETSEVSQAPWRLLDARGQLGQPGDQAQPLVIRTGTKPTPSLENPPGLYGTNDGFVALNLFEGARALSPVSELAGSNISVRQYVDAAALELRPILLAIALGLLALDCLAVLWMAGRLNMRRLARASAIALAVAVAGSASDSVAQENSALPEEFQATLQTRLAYVITGVSDVDEMSRRALTGLTAFIGSRTSLEPGPPVGVDVAEDELNFYPLIYWPVSVDAEKPDRAAMARVDAFMKQGGTVLFDTRDQLSGGFSGSGTSAETFWLRELLSQLDIPPLEPVPSDHVLTKAFYLLDTFPGRFFGGNLWVEASTSDTGGRRPARVGDGVSSIIITSNDFAGAWAVDPSGRPLLPTIPPDPRQRIFAYRTGVNLVMYTLTGNYKSDQVHIPALLERLGQ